MSIRGRQVMLFALAWAFAAQTWLVYSDPVGTEHRLTSLALEGQSVWREKNCQSCHQLYGFGGFLGPDLTNAIDGLSAERLESILTAGAGQMPAFHLEAAQRVALTAFFEEIDATGVAQAKLGEAVPPGAFLRRLTETTEPLPATLARGRELVLAQGCIGCHLPNGESLHRSTDLTLLTETIGQPELARILHDGIPGTAMPRLGMPDQDAAAVFEFLAWMNERGDELRGRFATLATGTELDLSRLPWFEYE